MERCERLLGLWTIMAQLAASRFGKASFDRCVRTILSKGVSRALKYDMRPCP